MQQINVGMAYVLCCLGIFGICGLQRFYTGNIVVGLIYLFTFGIFGIGQVIDLLLIPGMVERRNAYLRGITGGNAPAGVNQSITVNLGDFEHLKPSQTAGANTSAAASPMQKLLRAAKQNGGNLSVAQAAMSTELDAQEVKQLLQQAEKDGFAEISNDPKTGAIRYRFDV